MQRQCSEQARVPSCRQERRNSKDYAEGFAMLDLDGGAPWDLLCSLMQACACAIMHVITSHALLPATMTPLVGHPVGRHTCLFSRLRS